MGINNQRKTLTKETILKEEEIRNRVRKLQGRRYMTVTCTNLVSSIPRVAFSFCFYDSLLRVFSLI